jgi:predicted deacylase
LIDYGIDFHTGGAARANFPQVRCLLGVDPEVDAMAEAFAAPFTLHAALRPGSLREAAQSLGKRIIVYETGESLRLDEPGIEGALAGTLRVMHHWAWGRWRRCHRGRVLCAVATRGCGRGLRASSGPWSRTGSI